MTNQVTVVRKDSFAKIRSAVDQTVDLIKPTFGPASNKVIIAKVTHAMVVDDGVQIARDLELADPVEHAIMKVVREVAIKTNDRVGDGTTGALIMTQAMIREIAQLPHFEGHKIEKELKEALDEAKQQLIKLARPIKTKEELEKVARISFDNADIAKMISGAWFKLGVDGVLTVDRSGTMQTELEMTDGIQLPRGYLSPYMITNPQRMEGVIEKPYILFTDYRLTEANDVINVMNQLAGKNITNLVIIAENVEGSALATLVINKMQGKFNCIAVTIPKDDTVMLEDLAMMTGAKFFSEKKGDKVDQAKIEDLGRAERFIARRTESVIIGPRGDKKTIAKAIVDLNMAVNGENDEKAKKQIQKRIARFGNKVGVIKVGAPTDNEVNALKYKVEDAVNATHAAFKSGVVTGGGIGLANIYTKSELMNDALKAPFRQLKLNSGVDSHRKLKKGEALNVVTGEIGDWMKVGVLDPLDVLIAQLESAVSIVSLLVTTSGMIVEAPKHLKQEEE